MMKTNDEQSDVLNMHAAVMVLKERLTDEYKRLFPIGSFASYMHGDNEIYVEIVRVTDRNIGVRNPNTGKGYQVDRSRFLDYRRAFTLKKSMNVLSDLSVPAIMKIFINPV